MKVFFDDSLFFLCYLWCSFTLVVSSFPDPFSLLDPISRLKMSDSVSRTFNEELLNFAASMITPGHRHPWALRILNFALIGLAFTLSFVLIFGDGNIHHVIMLCMTVILFVAVHWFLRAIDSLPPTEEEKKQK